MKYSEFKKEAGIVDWATDKLLSSKAFGFGSKEEYQRRQNVYNEIKNQPKQEQQPYTVTSSVPNTVTGTKPPTQPNNPNHVIGADAFNNDRINNIQDAATRDAYMDFVLKGGAFAQQVKDTNGDVSKMNINDVASNPNVVNSIGTALENASPAALDSFMRIGKQYQEMVAKGNAGGTGSNGGSVNTAMEKAKDQLTGSFVKGLWNNVKANPIQMIPQIAGMFLRYIGAGDSIANFASNPLAFYLSLAGLLLGGGMLLSGGSDDDEKPVVNNYYNQPAGYNRIPYT